MATTYFIIACWTLDAAIRRRDSLLLRHRSSLSANDIAALTSTVLPLVTLLPHDCKPCPPKTRSGKVIVEPASPSAMSTTGLRARLDNWTASGPEMPDEGPFLSVSPTGFTAIADAEAWLQTPDGMVFSDSASNLFVVGVA